MLGSERGLRVRSQELWHDCGGDAAAHAGPEQPACGGATDSGGTAGDFPSPLFLHVARTSLISL